MIFRGRSQASLSRQANRIRRKFRGAIANNLRCTQLAIAVLFGKISQHRIFGVIILGV